MTLRFLQMVEWEAAGFPLLPGYELHVTGLTPEVRRWLRLGIAEVVREAPEMAVLRPRERAVTRRAHA